MGLFGALFAGVSGLGSQSNKISIISNNIANVNTVGYKQDAAGFDSLVVTSGAAGSFSPGGALGQTHQLVDQQGLVQSTSSPTDVAISGNGFFTVNTKADTTGQTQFTRSGSFTQDALGNFVNSNGDFLQAWALDANGNPPANKANFTSLVTVNVKSNASGAAVATSNVTLAANLNAAQTTLLGAGETVKLSGNNNIGISASQLIVGNDPANALNNTNSGIIRGDKFTATSSGNSTPFTFTYGGLSIGRDITQILSANGKGDGGNTLDTGATGEAILATNMATNTSGAVTITVGDAANYTVGQTASITGVVGNIGASGITAAEVNGFRTVTAVGAGTITIQSGHVGATTAVAGAGSAFGLTNRTAFFAGNVLDASNASDLFLGTTGTGGFTAKALNFQITTSGGTTSTFTYTGTAPDVTNGQFNNLNTLAQAISDASGLTARVVGGQLYVGATNANLGLTFSNGDATGNGTQNGINWVQELDLPPPALQGTNDINAAAATGEQRFNSLNSLATAVNTTTNTTGGLIAEVTNPLGSSTLTINENDPQQTVIFTDVPTPVPSRQLLDEFSFASAGNVALFPLPLLPCHS